MLSARTVSIDTTLLVTTMFWQANGRLAAMLYKGSMRQSSRVSSWRENFMFMVLETIAFHF